MDIVTAGLFPRALGPIVGSGDTKEKGLSYHHGGGALSCGLWSHRLSTNIPLDWQRGQTGHRLGPRASCLGNQTCLAPLTTADR